MQQARDEIFLLICHCAACEDNVGLEPFIICGRCCSAAVNRALHYLTVSGTVWILCK